MAMIETLEAWWRRAGKALALFGMAMLGLIDVFYGHIFIVTGRLMFPVALMQVALAIATAVVWLSARRLGPTRLAIVASVLAGWSLAFTGGYVLFGFITGSLSLREVGFWGLAESVGLLGMTYVLARLARPGLAVLGVAATGLAVSALPLRTGLETNRVIIGMTYALLAAGAAAAGMYFRMVEAARERQLATVRAEQRAEFARDLHDFIAHHVTGIVVQAQGARYVAEHEPQRAVAALEQIERAGAEAMTAMRRMVGVLRGQGAAADSPLAPLAGLAEVPELVRNFSAVGETVGGARAWLHTEGRLDDLPVEVTSSAYRVIMEALTNVRQHATGATRVDVRISRTRDWLLVRVTNDGPAPPGGHRTGEPRSGHRPGRTGFGLAGLTERVTALGGRLRAGPGIDGGWEVDVALPLAEQAARR